MKNKKLITAIILTIIALSATCYNPRKYDDENDFIVTVHDKTVEITGYKGTKTDVNIPPRIGKLPVTAIGEEAFFSKKLTSVKIPGSVKRIGNAAFYGNRIERVIIPSNVTEIGGAVFAYNKITEIVFPDRITEISRYMFAGNKLTGIKIPETVIT
ncbi:MAG: leucine-rich repeat domain-containing protein, partial [Treponema sp.]|nr:leucine-rich repeat domain-containing protein [Treponema sp.]